MATLPDIQMLQPGEEGGGEDMSTWKLNDNLPVGVVTKDNCPKANCFLTDRVAYAVWESDISGRTRNKRWPGDFTAEGIIAVRRREHRGPAALDRNNKPVKVSWQVTKDGKTSTKYYTFGGNPNWRGMNNAASAGPPPANSVATHAPRKARSTKRKRSTRAMSDTESTTTRTPTPLSGSPRQSNQSPPEHELALLRSENDSLKQENSALKQECDALRQQLDIISRRRTMV